jgi:hypothetical protein
MFVEEEKSRVQVSVLDLMGYDMICKPKSSGWPGHNEFSKAKRSSITEATA